MTRMESLIFASITFIVGVVVGSNYPHVDPGRPEDFSDEAFVGNAIHETPTPDPHPGEVWVFPPSDPFHEGYEIYIVAVKDGYYQYTYGEPEDYSIKWSSPVRWLEGAHKKETVPPIASVALPDVITDCDGGADTELFEFIEVTDPIDFNDDLWTATITMDARGVGSIQLCPCPKCGYDPRVEYIESKEAPHDDR